MDAVWIGIDIGTGAVRAAAYTTAGALVATGVAERPPRAPQVGAMVHDPREDWWEGSCEALRAVRAQTQGTKVQGIGLAGLFPAVVLLDELRQPVTEGILHGDTRAAADVSWVSRRLGVPLIGDEVVARLRWLRRERAEAYRSARLALGPAGYVGFRLTGEAVIDPHSALRWGPGLVNAERTGWRVEAARRLEIDPNILPPIRKSTDLLGFVTAEAAAATGLPRDTPVVVGLTDTLAQLLGDGVSRPGEVMVYYGSTGTLTTCTLDLASAVAEPTRLDTSVPYRLAVYATGYGRLLEQARVEWFGGLAIEALDAEAGQIPPGASGIFVVPARSGPEGPSGHAVQGTAVVGVTPGHRRGHLWRALLEGFGFLLRQTGEELRLEPSRVVAAGGGARSQEWRQIVSDITGWVQMAAAPGGAARGAALLAAHALGGTQPLSDLSEAWAAHSRHSRASQSIPEPRRHRLYETLFRSWSRLDAAMHDWWAETSSEFS